MAAIWYSYGRMSADNPAKMYRVRYREMLVQRPIFHESIYYQNQAGLLDPLVYESWARDLASTAGDHDLSVVATDLRSFFPGGFGEHVLALQEKSTATGA